MITGDAMVDVGYDDEKLICNWRLDADFHPDVIRYTAARSHIVVVMPNNYDLEIKIAAHAIAVQGIVNRPVEVLDVLSRCCVCLQDVIIGSWYESNDLGGRVFICLPCCDRMRDTKVNVIDIITDEIGCDDKMIEAKVTNTDTNGIDTIMKAKVTIQRYTCVYGRYIVIRENGNTCGYKYHYYQSIRPGELVKLRGHPVVMANAANIRLCILCCACMVELPDCVCEYCWRLNISVWARRYWLAIPALDELVPRDLVETIVTRLAG